MEKTVSTFTVFLFFAMLVSGAHLNAEAGNLKFYANGEGLATEGFTAPELTKDGWKLTFSHVFVSLSEITAYQADPPFNPDSGSDIQAGETVRLEGTHVVDLSAGTEDHPPVLVGEVKGVPAGHYNAVSWKMAAEPDGPLAGYTMYLTGVAEKDGKKVNFKIRTAEESTYKCGEFVGDDRKGLLAEDGEADIEMTFHLDHVFGRADKGADDPMNRKALGFAPFADASRVHEIKLKGLHMGHAGEGHCSVQWH